LLSEHFNLPTDHHAWSCEQQQQFVRSTNEHLKTLQSWCFPESRRMDEAKKKISPLLWQMCQEYGLTVGQMRKVINDILAVHPVNGNA
jgi:hypothetical protein